VVPPTRRPRWTDLTRAGQHAAAIAALIELGDLPKAAAKLHVKPATLAGWQQDPDFAAAYKAALLSKFELTLGLLQVAAEEAVGVLFAVMRNGKGDADKLRAARHVIELARTASNRDVIRRLAAIESALTKRKERT
jgi:hypothetical protein